MENASCFVVHEIISHLLLNNDKVYKKCDLKICVIASLAHRLYKNTRKTSI